jgi:site-specific DNA recombinase
MGRRSAPLNDRGDDSPEGDLTDDILNQLAKYERAKMAERTRRGKLQKARSGKVVGGHPVNYSFRMNVARDAYEVDERKMSVVRRIFRMIGKEGLAITAVAKVLNEEGEPGPTGGRWNTKAIRWFVLDDVRAPGPGQALRDLVVQPRALAAHQDLGAVPTGEGRDYRSKVISVPRPRVE